MPKQVHFRPSARKLTQIEGFWLRKKEDLEAFSVGSSIKILAYSTRLVNFQVTQTRLEAKIP